MTWRGGSQKVVIVLPAGKWQRPAVTAAKRHGLGTIGIDSSYGAEALTDCDFTLVHPLDDVDFMLSFVARLNVQVAGVISYCSDVGVVPSSRIRNALGVAGPSISTCLTVTDKALQREAYHEAGVPSVGFRVTSSQIHPQEIEKELGRTVVVKPIDGSGSRGVSVVETTEDELWKALSIALATSRRRQAIVEEYIAGVEFTVDMFAVGGKWNLLAVAEKTKAPNSLTVSDSLTVLDSDDARVEALFECAQSAAAATGLDSGPLHGEFIWHPNRGPVVVEIAARGGGFMLNEGLIPMSTGLAPSELTVLNAIGRLEKMPDFHRRPAALAFLPTQPGIIAQVRHPESTTNARVGILVAEGCDTRILQGDGERAAYALAVGDSGAEALETARRALSQVDIVYID